MSILLNDGLRIQGAIPAEDKRLNNGVPYTSISEVNNLIIPTDRYPGLEVIITNGNVNKKYWYKDGILDTDLIEDVASVNPTILTQYTESTVPGMAGSNLIQPDLGLPILEIGDLQENSSYSGELVLNIENNDTATAKVIELFGAEIYNNTNPSSVITAKITFTLNFFNQAGNDIDYKLSWEYLSSGEILFGEHTETIDNTSNINFELLVTGHSTDSFNLKKARIWRN